MSVDFRTVKGKHRRVGQSLISELKRGRCIPGRKIKTLRQLQKNKADYV